CLLFFPSSCSFPPLLLAQQGLNRGSCPDRVDFFLREQQCESVPSNGPLIKAELLCKLPVGFPGGDADLNPEQAVFSAHWICSGPLAFAASWRLKYMLVLLHEISP